MHCMCWLSGSLHCLPCDAAAEEPLPATELDVLDSNGQVLQPLIVPDHFTVFQLRCVQLPLMRR